MSKVVNSKKLDLPSSTDSVVNQVHFKQKKLQRKKVRITKVFLSDVLNQSKMKEINDYLKQNQLKYVDKVFQHGESYSLYEDYLLLNTIKKCQDKIYANNMNFYLSQIKIQNTKRTQHSYCWHLYNLVKNLQQTQKKSKRRIRIKNRDKNDVKNNIIKHLNSLLDKETLQILKKYIAQHEKQIENQRQIALTHKIRCFTLLQDCLLLKEFKQKINQYESWKESQEFLSKIFKRRKYSIFQRLQYLLNVNKEKLVFCIQNNLTIKVKFRTAKKSKPIIQNMKFFVNQLILKYLKQQLEQKTKKYNSSKINIQFIKDLLILLYVKKYLGFITLRQLFSIVSQKIFLNRITLTNKFYKIVSKLQSNQKFSQKIQKSFQNILAKLQFQPQQNQDQEALEVNSKQKTIQANDKILNLSENNVSEVDIFISKLSQSNFKQNTESIMDILREIESSVKNQNSYFMDQHTHDELFFSDEQQKQDAKNHHNHSLFVEEKASKKQKKNQKRKIKSKMTGTKQLKTELEENNLTLTESLAYEHNLQYFKQKWNLKHQTSQQTVYYEPIQAKQQNQMN